LTAGAQLLNRLGERIVEHPDVARIADEVEAGLMFCCECGRAIEPGSPWENGDLESFNGKMRAQFLNGELF